MATGDVHACSAGAHQLVAVSLNVSGGVSGHGVTVDDETGAIVAGSIGREGKGPLNVVVVQQVGAVGRPARVVEANVVFHQRLIGLVDDLIPGNFTADQVVYLVLLQKLRQVAPAVAVAAINVLGRVVAHGQRLLGRTVAAPLVDGDARGRLEVVVLNRY